MESPGNTISPTCNRNFTCYKRAVELQNKVSIEVEVKCEETWEYKNGVKPEFGIYCNTLSPDNGASFLSGYVSDFSDFLVTFIRKLLVTLSYRVLVC